MHENQNMFVAFYYIDSLYKPSVDMLKNFFTEHITRMAMDPYYSTSPNRIADKSSVHESSLPKVKVLPFSRFSNSSARSNSSRGI